MLNIYEKISLSNNSFILNCYIIRPSTRKLSNLEDFQHAGVGGLHTGHKEILAVPLLERVGHLGVGAHVAVGGRH